MIVTIVVAVIVAMLFLLFVIVTTGVCMAAYLKRPASKPVDEPDIGPTYAEAGHVADSHFIMTPSAVYGQVRKRPREPFPDVMTGNTAYNLNVSAVNRIPAELPDVMTKNSAYDTDEVHVAENAAYNVDVSAVNVVAECPDVTSELPDVMTKNSAYDVDEVHVAENAAYNVDVSAVNMCPDVIMENAACSSNTFEVVAELPDDVMTENAAYNVNEASACIVTSKSADDGGIYEILD